MPIDFNAAWFVVKLLAVASLILLSISYAVRNPSYWNNEKRGQLHAMTILVVSITVLLAAIVRFLAQE